MTMEGTSFCEGYMGTAFDSFPCGLCICQIKEGQILPGYCNPAFYEILGCSGKKRPDSGRMLDWDRVHPEDAGILKEKLAKLIQSKGRFTRTLSVCSITGKMITSGSGWRVPQNRRTAGNLCSTGC